MLTVKDGPGVYRGQFFTSRPCFAPLAKSERNPLHPTATPFHHTNQIKS